MIKNLEKAAEICKSIKGKVVIYGDSDMDGATSVYIMKEIFHYLGNDKLTFYFPDRAKDGYGINKKALDEFFRAIEPCWVFTVDCGIGNVKEINVLNEMGFRAVVIDHHRPLEKLPPAELIVDPHQDGETNDFKEFSNAGLCLRLAELIIKDDRKLRELYALTALANLADQVPQQDENEEMNKKGLELLPGIENIGMQELSTLVGVSNTSKAEVITKLVSTFNAADNTKNLNDIFHLLTSKSNKEANVWAQKLIQTSLEKREKKRKVVKEVLDWADTQDIHAFIFKGSKKWKLLSLGSAASEVMQSYELPVFLFSIDDNYCSGSARLPRGYDGVAALMYAKDSLVTYGGHPPACGFKFKTSDMQKVKEKLEEYFLYEADNN